MVAENNRRSGNDHKKWNNPGKKARSTRAKNNSVVVDETWGAVRGGITLESGARGEEAWSLVPRYGRGLALWWGEGAVVLGPSPRVAASAGGIHERAYGLDGL